MERKYYYTGLILKYLAGELQPAENKTLQVWLAEHEDHRELFQAIQSNWQSPAASDVQKSETAYQQLTHRLGLQDKLITRNHQKIILKPNTFWLKIAVSFTGLLIIGAIAYYLLSAPETTLYQTGYGETTTFLLPDSSEVTLNANSSLEYTANWQGQSMREVWLEGEALFHVRKIHQNQASKLPAKFVVHTSQVDVEVLGTEFNVNERRGKTTVVLNSGKVKLNSNMSQNETLVMEPGEYVELSAARQQFVKKMVDPEVFLSWTEKKLMMDNTPLREIAQIIEDYYGIKVIFEDIGLAEKALTGSIPTDNLNTFLTVLSASIDVKMHREGDTVVIRNKEAP